MTANFDRWEKDPFFSAAEEIQESADRMESTYRTWLHSMKDTTIDWNLEDLRRELCTSLDTTKWQLEEFERAVRNSYKSNGADEARDRHRQFVLAMECKISPVQKSLKDSAASVSKPPRCVQSNEGEHDELALFLSGPTESNNRTEVQVRGRNEKRTGSQTVGGKVSGHRRSASANADISSWNINIGDDELPSQLSTVRVVGEPLRRAPSLSLFIETTEPALKPKLPKNGFRKWKPADVQQENDAALLRSQPQGRGNQASYERNKSCLSSSDDCYDKQLHGWYGALQRLLQRSLYHLQYTRSVQTMFWVALLLFSIVILLVRVL